MSSQTPSRARWFRPCRTTGWIFRFLQVAPEFLFTSSNRSRSRSAPLHPTDDPVADLRSAWSLTVEFGRHNPELFLLIYGEPHSVAMPAAVRSGAQRMHARIQRVAAAGRLRVSESLAATILQASSRGAVLTWLDQSAAERELLTEWLDRLSAESATG